MCDSSQKHVLLVFAHQDNKSFNGALRDVAVDTLRKLGHTVEVSDLYSNHFKSRATRNDIRGKPFVF
jgi:putative NADPH-quinone reductase